MLSEKIVIKILKEKYGVKTKELNDYIVVAKKQKKTLEQYIIDENIADEIELYVEVAAKLKMPFVSLKGKEIKKEILNIIPAPLAQTHQMIVFATSKDEMQLAMLDPTDIQTIEFIQRKTNLNPKVYLTTPTDIRDALRRYHADLGDDMSIEQLKEGPTDGAGDLKKAAEELPVVNIVNNILEHAVFEGSSDIHIEPQEKEVIIRYRVDGILKNVMTLPKTIQSGIIARIKILSKLKIDEHMVPQDGRFKIKLQDEKLSFRVSIIPVYDGEKIVMRLLHEGQKPLDLDQLGFLPGPKKKVERAIRSPHGMILVTGPTGSGKTTTLYSILGLLNKPGVNICTIEDPIEYHVKGINQSQINPRAGFTFAGGLRSFLRQDPDIIMVGEIRDKETAEIAIHSAMTGHLVLSTLHTNDAPTTIPRLVDMDIPAFLIAFTANIIIAQRLVRQMCEHCKKELILDKDAIAELEKIVDTKKLLELFKENDINLKKEETSFNSFTFWRGEGCRHCNNSGYKGRIGIYEVLEVDSTLTAKINSGANADQIKEYANQQGMISMLQDGLIKAKQGVTTIEEVLRATRE
ncbi:MAG: ATPase, T2SS/T4P/T4SS family [bacterium]|nr:ATPase, T2SS/T4P/T4SS family [bacterium]